MFLKHPPFSRKFYFFKAIGCFDFFFSEHSPVSHSESFLHLFQDLQGYRNCHGKTEGFF